MPEKAARRLARVALDAAPHVAEAVRDGRPADATLREYFRVRRHLGARDRRFLSDLVFSYFRWLGWTAALEPLGSEAVCAVSHLLDADALHPVAAVLLAESPLRPVRAVPLGSLGLEPKAQQFAELCGLPCPRAQDLVPPWLADLLAVPGGADAREHLLRLVGAFQSRPPAWLRASEGRRDDVLAALGEAGIAAQLHERVPSSIAVDGRSPLHTLGATRQHFVIQDLASQCVGHICAAAAGSCWWDACAGAGGKSLQLAELVGRHGCVVASDPRAPALAELRQRARRTHTPGIRTLADGSSPPDGLFDGVLVDAPCSGIGTWSRNPDARWRTTERAVARMAGIQTGILDDAAPRVRPGGALVYAVCTVTGQETLDVLRAFLDRHPGFRLDPVPHPLTGEPTDGTVWIWPWEGPCDGMFVGRMVKDR